MEMIVVQAYDGIRPIANENLEELAVYTYWARRWHRKLRLRVHDSNRFKVQELVHAAYIWCRDREYEYQYEDFVETVLYMLQSHKIAYELITMRGECDNVCNRK